MSDVRPARHNRPSHEDEAASGDARDRAAIEIACRLGAAAPASRTTQTGRGATLSDKKLRDMLACASDFCEQRFERDGAIEPMWHAVTASGESFIEHALPDFDEPEAIATIHALFDLRDVVRYVFIYEAWTLAGLLPADEMDRVSRSGLAAHPERIEVVTLQGEDRACGQIVAHRRIIRPAGRQPYLGALETMEEVLHLPRGAAIQFQGRMVGLLPVRGTRH
jgi:hypothetical protein